MIDTARGQLSLSRRHRLEELRVSVELSKFDRETRPSGPRRPMARSHIPGERERWGVSADTPGGERIASLEETCFDPDIPNGVDPIGARIVVYRIVEP
jgi:hypothetical protein